MDETVGDGSSVWLGATAMNLQEFIEQKLSGNLPDGQMMIDNDCWIYLVSADEQYEIDITEPGLLEALSAWGIKWERV